MNVSFKGEEQNLQDILSSRDERAQIQKYFLEKYKSPLISYKLNIPGPIKYNSLIKEIFDDGLLAAKNELTKASIEIIDEKVLYKNSGPEYFASFKDTPSLIKEITTVIEETHPLGRLFDFDILDLDGNQLSRQELGRAPRKCLMCEKNAFECGRSRNHSIDELVDYIEKIALAYFNQESI
jgi:holo-ACP synthase CitX